ncbi:MAG: YhgE/Pip family protein, partial [Dermatophilaceae bacterium]
TATLAGKLPQLAAGASQLASGAGKVADGASLSAEGTASLRDGVTSIASGSSQLGSGATELRDGLQSGVSKIPTYSEAERAALAAAAATPVTAEATRVNAVKNNGSGLAPYFMAIALWVGGLALYLLLRPLSLRALASSAPSPLVALAGYLPAALLATVQGIALALVMHYVVGVQAASVTRLAAVAVLAALTFTAINQALVAMFGTAGRFVAVVLAGLQMTSAGGTYSVETAPVLFQWLHDLLPLTYAVDALRKVIAGSSVGLSHDITVLVLTLVGSLLVSMYAARRQRTWTITRLRPVVAA